MKKITITAILAATVLVAGLMTVADLSVFAAPEKKDFKALLDGFQEVPSVSTAGSGTFKAKLKNDEIKYELEYSGLEGSVAPAAGAHIHLGQSGANGGIMVFLCETPGVVEDPTDNAPACPEEGTVEGTFSSENIIGPSGQGIEAGEFDEFLTALRAGNAYINLHSSAFPGGEIRGQIR